MDCDPNADNLGECRVLQGQAKILRLPWLLVRAGGRIAQRSRSHLPLRVHIDRTASGG
jgi:hypothetical protein